MHSRQILNSLAYRLRIFLATTFPFLDSSNTPEGPIMDTLHGWNSWLETSDAITWLAPLCSAVFVAESLVLLANCF
jgi:hypothetical protein